MKVDRKKQAQLSRRLRAAKARYRSLEKRSAVIEETRQRLEEKSGRLFDLLFSPAGKRAGKQRRESLARQFKQAKDKAQKLRTLEDTIYRQLKDSEEKIANLEDNMRKASRKNPGRKHIAGATATQQRQYEAIKRSELKRGESKKTAKRIAAATVRKRANPKRKPSPAQLRARKKFVAMVRARARAAKLKRRNSSATKTLKKAAGAAKTAIRSTLDAGSKLLGAGAKALNPRKRRNAKKIVKVRAKKVVVVNPRKRRKAVTRRHNASPVSIRKKFAGTYNGDKTLYFPDGTPSGLAKLGRLVKIKARRGTVRPTGKNPSGEVWLCADTHGRLHLGSTRNAPLVAGEPRDFGEVEMIEYQEKKPHLGYKNPIIWFHKMGEEGGRRPTLHANGKGELKFKGGSYKIKREGITD
jgi:hypothetical protein